MGFDMGEPCILGSLFALLRLMERTIVAREPGVAPLQRLHLTILKSDHLAGYIEKGFGQPQSLEAYSRARLPIRGRRFIQGFVLCRLGAGGGAPC